VQDFESAQTEMPDTFDVTLPQSAGGDALESDDKGATRPAQREGLPSHYRMRAERHYVDSITSASAGVPIRLIPLAQFEVPTSDGTGNIESLVKSVRVHGVIQPLLVRKRQTRYEVIAGKRRFTAAATLGLTEVPCVLHQVDDATAESLAAAENIRTQPAGSLRAVVGAQIAEAIGRVADDVMRVQSSLTVLRSAPEGYERAVSADLVAAQAFRTLWLANTAALLAGGKVRPGKRRPLSAVLDELLRQFEPECRLTGLKLEIVSAVPPVTVDDGFVTIALVGAVMMTLSLLEQVRQPIVELQTRQLDAGGIAIQVSQRHVPASQDVIDRFLTRTRSAWTPMIFALGAMALEHATAAHGGASDLVALDEGGSSVQLTFCRF
jgi:ParB-like chromosome segregation protein Spo0J